MKIGMITIGQSPRPDLAGPVRAALPAHEVLESGALDDLTPGHPSPIASGSVPYPLMTTLRDGRAVIVDETAVGPSLQFAQQRLEQAGAAICLLACAGPFAGLRGNVPIVRPFATAVVTMRAAGFERIGVICPSEGQRPGCERKWQAAGFDAAIWTPEGGLRGLDADWLRERVEAAPALACVVLDYVGSPAATVASLRTALPIPLIDPGQSAIDALVSLTGS